MSRRTARTKAGSAGADLDDALTVALSGHFDKPPEIVRIQRRPSPYRTSFVLEELDVHLKDGTILPLLFKDLGPRALHKTARQAKPPFLYNPRREIEIYEKVLADARLGTATCYGSVLNAARNRFWLFLERVPGTPLSEVGDLAVWQGAARWLAAFHSRFVDSAFLGALAGSKQTAEDAEERRERQTHGVPVLCYDEKFYRRWLRRARAFAARGAGSRGARSKLERLAECYDGVVEQLLALPVTLIHGEFYASNVLVQTGRIPPLPRGKEERPSRGRKKAALRVCPVDWEMAAVGPGLVDLAALVSGKWTEEKRKALALAYRGALDPRAAGSASAFERALDSCRLHLAVQWLGWSSRWRPPRQHAHDWLGEALSLAEKLDL